MALTDARPDDSSEPELTRVPVAPDDAAVALAADGDELAFAALYVYLQPRLVRYAASLVGQEADDVTAEAWLHIARDVGHFSGGLDSFRAWTARIVRNRAMDHLRARGRRRTDPAPIETMPDVIADDDPERETLDRASTAQAVALIASLPREQAEAVMLRAVVGLDAKRAGQVLGKSAAAVRVSAHRGLRTLESRLHRTTPEAGGESHA